MADFSIRGDTKLNPDGVNSGVKEINESLATVSAGFSAVARTAVNAFSDAARAGISYNAKLEQYTVAYTTLLGSEQAALEAIAQIQQDAAATPFDTDGLVLANQLLISAGVSAADSRDTIMALGDAVSATGGGNEELSRMAQNLQQVKNTGKATAMDVRQFAMAGINIYGLLADYTGKTTAEVQNMDITYEELAGALQHASSEGGKFYGAMETQSHTLNGQLSTLKDNVQIKLGEAFEKVSQLLSQEVLPAIIEFIDGIDVDEVIQTIESMMPVLVAIGTTIATIFVADKISTFIGLITNMGGVIKALGLAFGALGGPVTIIMAIIAGLVAAFIYLWNTCEPFRQFFIDLWQGIQSCFTAAVEWIGGCVNSIVEFFTVTIPGAITSFANRLVEFVTVTIPQFITGVVDWFAQLPGKIWTWLVNTIVNIATWALELQQKGRTAASNFLNNVISFIQQLPGKIWTWLTTTISKVATFASDLLSKGIDAAKGFVKNLVDGVKSLPEKFLNIGKNIVDGIWNGICAGWTWLVDSVKGLANSLFEGVKSALGIHSPSTKFAWIGKMSAVGLENGYEDENPLLKIKKNIALQLGNLGSIFDVKGSGAGTVIYNNTDNSVVNFNKDMQAPDEVSRALRLQRRYGLAGA